MKYLMVIFIVFALLNFLVPRAQQDIANEMNRTPALMVVNR